MKTKAFTLIELLIVVAIIAILAAIAVPNFLEAQARSKVSRVKADMRTLATAIEAYYVDANKYPLCHPPWIVNRQHFASHTWLRFEWQDGKHYDQISSTFWENNGACLTTPIAYISSIPWDPFTSNYWSTLPPGSWGWPSIPQNTSCMYAYGYQWDWVRDIYGGYRSSNPILYPDMGYAMYSCGPASYLSWPPIVYDPTNGTVSVGLLIYIRGASFVPMSGMEGP